MRSVWKKMKPFQRRGVKIVSRRFKGRAILADEMGLGKTIQALGFMEYEEVDCTVVICPANVKYVWEQQAREHAGIRALVLEGQKPPRGGIKALVRKRPRLVVINYEILQYWYKHLRKLRPELVVIDECQRIKSRNTISYRRVKGLCTLDSVFFILALSGTPITNRAEEFFTTLNILLPRVFPAYVPYIQEFCAATRNRWGGWDARGTSNQRKLNKILRKRCMVRRLVKDVLEELPPVVQEVVPIQQITNRREYQECKDDYLNWVTKLGSTKAKRAKRAQQITKLNYMLQLAAEGKLKDVKEWIDQFLEDTDEKIVIFGIHRNILRPLHDHYSDQSVIIDGKVRGKYRKRAVRKFRRSKRCRICFGQIDSIGTGVDGLQYAANHAAFVELPWTPGQLLQCIARIRRMGQEKPTFSYYLVARKTIEQTLAKALKTKQKNLRQILNGDFSINPDEDEEVFQILERSIR